MKNQLAKPLIKSSHHTVYSIRLHIVFVTKYRRKVIPEMLIYLDKAFAEILTAWNCELIEFGGEEDHVHLLISIKPALNIPVLVNNLKTASARRVRGELPRAYAHGIIKAKLRLLAGVLSSENFHPQAYACGITE
jgi:REP element-mobilizing transposase RayT